jgi:hypothetical protein
MVEGMSSASFPDDSEHPGYSGELEGQTSINEELIRMGEKPVEEIVIAELTDEEIADFLSQS